MLLQGKENMVSPAGTRPGVLTPTVAAAECCTTSCVGSAMGQAGSHVSSYSWLRWGSWIGAQKSLSKDLWSRAACLVSCIAKLLLVSQCACYTARWRENSSCLMLFAVPALHSLVRQCWLVIKSRAVKCASGVIIFFFGNFLKTGLIFNAR